MPDLIKQSEVLVWFRPERKRPWELVHRAASYSIAVGLIGFGRKGGDWYLGYKEAKFIPTGEDYVPPNKENLPPRISTLPPKQPISDERIVP